MENIDRNQMLEVAVHAARSAGDRLLGVSQRRVNSAAGNDVKLQEDVESEIFIRGLLASTGIPVIGEEEGGDWSLVKSGKPYWIIDPIDGTYNFLRGIPGVCVSVALMRGLKPIVGCVYDFTRGEIFSGGDGLALSLNGACVSPNWASEACQAVLMTGFPSLTDYSDSHLDRFVKSVQKFKKVRMCGSAALAMCWVAVGRADIYAEERVRLWDIAGGLALMESAGAAYSLSEADSESAPLCYSIQAAARREFFVF